MHIPVPETQIVNFGNHDAVKHKSAYTPTRLIELHYIGQYEAHRTNGR